MVCATTPAMSGVDQRATGVVTRRAARATLQCMFGDGDGKGSNLRKKWAFAQVSENAISGERENGAAPTPQEQHSCSFDHLIGAGEQ
jgi:hypothetical protein